jgi:hypothetical protein
MRNRVRNLKLMESAVLSFTKIDNEFAFFAPAGCAGAGGAARAIYGAFLPSNVCIQSYHLCLHFDVIRKELIL